METLLKVAQLRVKGKPDEALAQVDAELQTARDSQRFLLMLQGLYAAEEAANEAKARRYASDLADIDPGLLSIQPYVALRPEDIKL
ncbi:hypothetical protein [Duganella sp. P38]|uniref:hypothetical protein n=1 Tax=Duganella sp. P38 TaxID=3423949 RepID=UPI003D7A97DB